MKDDRKIGDFRDALNCLLTCGLDLNRHTKYSLIYKISDDISKRQKEIHDCPAPKGISDFDGKYIIPQPYWTVDALNQYNINKNNKVSPFLFIHSEHVIPRSVVIDWLIDSPTPAVNVRIDRAIALFSTICWVTGRGSKSNPNTNLNSEQTILDKGSFQPSGGRIRNSMPPGWNVGSGSIWDRYQYVKGNNPKLGLSFLKIV